MLSSPQIQQNTARGWVAYAFSGSLVKRNSLIALFVGCILSVINQYDALDRHVFTSKLALQLILNFMIPFTVLTVSALVNRGCQER
jgi:putative flippase GtrA